MPGLLFCVSASFRGRGRAALRARLLTVMPLTQRLQIRGGVVVTVVDVVYLVCGLPAFAARIVAHVLAASPVTFEYVAADPPPIRRQCRLACRRARNPPACHPRPVRSWRMR